MHTIKAWVFSYTSMREEDHICSWSEHPKPEERHNVDRTHVSARLRLKTPAQNVTHADFVLCPLTSESYETMRPAKMLARGLNYWKRLRKHGAHWIALSFSDYSEYGRASSCQDNVLLCALRTRRILPRRSPQQEIKSWCDPEVWR